MKLIGFILIALSLPSLSLSRSPVSCPNLDEYRIENAIEIEKFSCDHENDCGILASFPDKYEYTEFGSISLVSRPGVDFQLHVFLDATERSSSVLEVSIYGSKRLVEGTDLFLSYKS